MAYSQNITFSSDGNTLFGRLYAPTKASITPGVLFMHGAGSATSERYIPWQEYLAARGFSSFSFDVRGVGKSGGEFSDGSLDNRLIDAIQAFETFVDSGYALADRIAVAGNSMGGHVATMLIERDPSIKAILLCCAAAYASDAEDKQLDETFTKVLRREGSWQDSKAFSILENYDGKVFVAYGDEEAVIPEGIQDRYLALAKPKDQAHIIHGIGHGILVPKTPAQEVATQSLFAFSAAFLTKAL